MNNLPAMVLFWGFVILGIGLFLCLILAWIIGEVLPRLKAIIRGNSQYREALKMGPPPGWSGEWPDIDWKGDSK